MNSWNGLDFLLFLIFVFNTLLGMARGATKEIISTICVITGLIFTIKFTVPLANFLNGSPLIQNVVNTPIMQNFMNSIGAGQLTVNLLNQIAYSISILICFVGVYSICEAVLHSTGIIEAFKFPFAVMDRKLGAALGCARGYIFVLIFLVILAQHLLQGNNSKAANDIISGSFFANLLQNQVIGLDNLITQQNPANYKKAYEGVNLYNANSVYQSIKQ